MVQEDQTQKCSNSSSGAGGGGGGGIVRSSKKQKPKRVPQRGLGVAQLERIRLEEQQKKDASSSSTTMQLPYSATKSSNHQPCSSSIPFQPAADHLSSSPKSIFRPPSPSVVQNVEILNSNSSDVPLPNPAGWEHAGNVHKSYNSCDFNSGNESSGVDQGSNFRSNMNSFPYESIPFWPLRSLMNKPQLQHPSSSMVYQSSANASSSVLNFRMEPPSNQSYYSNYLPMWTEEEKMVGLKRPYPFSLDHPPGFSSLHSKIPPIFHNHPRVSRSEDSASGSSGQTLIFELSNPISREGSSCSNFMLEPNNNIMKNIKENGILNGGFLTLAPPTTSLCQGSKFNHSPHFLASNSSEFPDFIKSLPDQGSVEDQIHQWGPNQRQPYYSFFPLSVAQTGQAASSMNNCDNGEVGESVDLNLKL